MNNILLVDDEKEITDLLEVYLVGEGYKVVKFYSAQGVMDCLQKEKIDIALLDIMLPDVDGFTLCHQIREHWFLPIIMITAKIESADKINGITIQHEQLVHFPLISNQRMKLQIIMNRKEYYV